MLDISRNVKKLKTTVAGNPATEDIVKQKVFQTFLYPRSPFNGDPEARPGTPWDVLGTPKHALAIPQGPPKGLLGHLRDPFRDKKASRIRSEIENTVVNTIEKLKKTIEN